MRMNRCARWIPCVLAIGALAACAGTPPSHYYSLMPDTVQPAQVHALAPAQHSYVVSVDPVSIPEQVDRPQIVLIEPDSAQVTPLSGYLWAAQLSEELRAALADDLSRRLGVLEIPHGQVPRGKGSWQIGVSVQRFDSYYGKQAVLDASWSATPHGVVKAKPAYCRARIAVPVGDGMSALVEGHKQALWTLSGLIAQHIEPGRAGGAPAALSNTTSDVQFNRCS